MKEKIFFFFFRLQKLQIQSGLENMEILLQTMYDLRDVYQELTGGESGAGTEGRDNH